MQYRWQIIRKWLTPGLGIKRWIALLIVGVAVISLTLAELILQAEGQPGLLSTLDFKLLPPVVWILLGLIAGGSMVGIGVLELNRTVLSPFSGKKGAKFIDVMYRHSFRQRGIKLVALGGGTGLPAVLRGFKSETSNITAIATVADDGGSSGKLRRELGVLPPGDLRNNIAALADDEMLMTQLFQYRFAEGGLEGHSFGNLFLTALANITGSMDQALIEAGRVLAIQGRVLPSTLQDVTLIGEVRTPDGLRRVIGESQIPLVEGTIERILIEPESVRAYPGSINAILTADLIVIGPGSLYTSVIPNLLVHGIPEAIKASHAITVYICNVATQQGETDNFSVADHVAAIERHVGKGLFTYILANNLYPRENAGENTHYVTPCPDDNDIRKRYRFIETDLTDSQRPWRHDPAKLRQALLPLVNPSFGRVEAIEAFVGGQPAEKGGGLSA